MYSQSLDYQLGFSEEFSVTNLAGKLTCSDLIRTKPWHILWAPEAPIYARRALLEFPCRAGLHLQALGKAAARDVVYEVITCGLQECVNNERRRARMQTLAPHAGESGGFTGTSPTV